MTWDALQTRREFLTAAAVAGFVVARRTPPHAETAAERHVPWTMYIGTYTKTGKSKGIYRVSVDPVTLQFGTLELASETPDPSFLAITPEAGHWWP